MGLGALYGGRLAGAQLSVYLKEALLHGVAGVLLHGGPDTVVVPEEVQKLLVRPKPQTAGKHRNRYLPVLVYAHVKHVVHVVLILQPGAPVGYYGRAEELLARAVVIHLEIHARGAHQLGDDNALRSVYHKGAALGHQGEVSHKYL